MEKKKPGPKQPNPETLAQFREAYLETGLNAYQAALRIGMKVSSARANAHRYARIVNLELKPALQAAGLTAEYRAKKLKQLCEAKTPKWNPKRQAWDLFDDGHLQLEAVKEINRVDDSYPAPKPEVEPTVVNVVINSAEL